MMDSDSASSAAASAARVSDSRLTAFHDCRHLLGRAMARTLGWKRHVAWDTYFIYRPGTLWTGADMPVPDAWFHQLKDREVWEQTAEAEVGNREWTRALAHTSEADPAQFRTGDDLRTAIETSLRQAATHAAIQPVPAGAAT
jgi:hypothetical protein